MFGSYKSYYYYYYCYYLSWVVQYRVSMNTPFWGKCTGCLFNAGSSSSSPCIYLRHRMAWHCCICQMNATPASVRHQSPIAVIWHVHVCCSMYQDSSGWQFIHCWWSSGVPHAVSFVALGICWKPRLCTILACSACPLHAAAMAWHPTALLLPGWLPGICANSPTSGRSLPVIIYRLSLSLLVIRLWR